MANSNTPDPLRDQSSLRSITLTLGMSVIAWSYLERAVDLLLGVLLEIHGVKPRAADLILSNIDIKQKASVAVALAYEIEISRAALELTISLMNTVQNELKSDRNRLFHDIWSYKEGAVSRRKTTGARISRPQSRKLELILPEATPVTANELQTFVTRCDDISDQIVSLGETLVASLQPNTTGQSTPQLHHQRTLWSRFLQYWR